MNLSGMQFIGINRIVLQNNNCNMFQYRGTQVMLFRRRIHIEHVKFDGWLYKNLYFSQIFNLTKRQFHNVKFDSILCVLNNKLKKVPTILKKHSVNIVKNCAEQCEFVLAQRIRRGQQIFSLYTKLWDEVALRHLLNRLKQQLSKRSTNFLLGAIGVSVYNWDKERITKEEIVQHSNEFGVVEKLRKCKTCRSKKDGSNDEINSDQWQEFIREENLVVWKKEEENNKGTGLYCYKMYGRYDDVTANDLFHVNIQTNLEERAPWDTLIITMRNLDSEPQTNSDVIYWENKWAKFFANRDYVFKRRYFIDHENLLITVVSKNTAHPDCPVYPKKVRVKEYWSYMVIKPFTEFDKPGVEFSLTYFDNPGLIIPSAFSSWVTFTALPDYIRRMRLASLEVAKKRLALQRDSKNPKSAPSKAPPPTIGKSKIALL